MITSKGIETAYEKIVRRTDQVYVYIDDVLSLKLVGTKAFKRQSGLKQKEIMEALVGFYDSSIGYKDFFDDVDAALGELELCVLAPKKTVREKIEKIIDEQQGSFIAKDIVAAASGHETIIKGVLSEYVKNGTIEIVGCGPDRSSNQNLYAKAGCNNIVRYPRKPEVITNYLIKNGPSKTKDVARDTGFTIGSVKGHFDRMRADGVVRSFKNGRDVYFEFAA